MQQEEAAGKRGRAAQAGPLADLQASQQGWPAAGAAKAYLNPFSGHTNSKVSPNSGLKGLAVRPGVLL